MKIVVDYPSADRPLNSYLGRRHPLEEIMSGTSSVLFAPYSPFKTRALWNILGNVKTSEEKYRVLKTLCMRLISSVDQNSIITPEALQCLKGLLGTDEAVTIRLMTLKVIRILANNTDMRMVLVRQGIALSLVHLLEVPCHPEALCEAQLELYREVCGLLMKLILSSFNNHRQILEYHILNDLARLLHPHKSPLYGFRPEALTYVEEHMLGQTMTGCVSKLGSKELNDLYLQCVRNPDELGMPKVGYSITNCEKCEELQQLGHLWPKTPEHMDYGREPVAQGSTSDLFVTHVISPFLFWALVGPEAVETVQNVEAILRNWPEDKKDMLMHTPKARSFVCGHEPDLGYFRGQVIDVADGDLVELFALDYGRIVKTHWKELFLLTPAIVENLKPYPPQVKLCSFKDVTPPPLSKHLIEVMLQTVMLLVSSASIIESHFKKSHLQVLLLLLRCPEASIRAGAADVLTNVAHSESLRDKIVANGALHTLLDIVGKYTYSASDHPSMEAVSSCLLAVGNMMHQHHENRILFAEHPNILMSVVMFCRRSLPEMLQLAARKVLRIFTGNADPLHCDESQPSRGRPHRSRSVGVKDEGWGPDRPVNRGRSRDHLCESDPDTHLRRESSRNRWKVQASLSSIQLSDEDHDVAANVVAIASSGSDGEGTFVKKLALRSPPNRELLRNAALENVVPLEATEEYLATKAQKQYIWGSKVDITPSETCETLVFNDVSQIKRKRMSQLFVSMFNTGKPCKIHIGILHGLVKGITIDRDFRDEFRLGVDAEMTKMQPCVMHSQYGMTFCPVVVECRDAAASTEVKQDVYVVEISLKPVAGVLYTTQSGECFVRQGTDMYLLKLQEIHERTVKIEEAKYVREINSLALEAGRLREEYQKKKARES